MSSVDVAVRVVRHADLSQAEIAEILRLCSAVFKRDYTPYMGTFGGATHVLLRRQGLLTSHALWVTRWLQCGASATMRTAYVEAVGTSEQHRNQSYATTVMKRLAEEIRDFDLAALSTGSPGFYTRLGWQNWRGPLFIRTQEGLMPTPEHRAMVLFTRNTPALDLDSPLSAEWREGDLW